MYRGTDVGIELPCVYLHAYQALTRRMGLQFYQEVCLLEQPFVLDPSLRIQVQFCGSGPLTSSACHLLASKGFKQLVAGMELSMVECIPEPYIPSVLLGSRCIQRIDPSDQLQLCYSQQTCKRRLFCMSSLRGLFAPSACMDCYCQLKDPTHRRYQLPSLPVLGLLSSRSGHLHLRTRGAEPSFG